MRVKAAFGPCLAAFLVLAHAGCSHPGGNEPANGGGGGAVSSGGTTASGGATPSGGTGAPAGAPGAAGQSCGAGGSVAAGGSTGTAGTPGPGTGGVSGGPGGTTALGGSTGTAGTPASGGTTPSGGSGGGQAGAGATGGTPAAGGSSGGAAGGTGGSAPTTDPGGVSLAKPGQCTSTTRQYLNLGDMRLINNRWGSDAIKCNGTTQQVCVNSDSTIGWSFNRPACGGNREYPDYPEVEFGVGPFGTGSSLLTTPAFSSTTLLPIQLQNLSSASINVDQFNTTIPANHYWNSNFEFWISKKDPTKNADAGVYAEIIVFLGWQANRQSSSGGWPCMVSGTIPNTNYNLCHQSDSWSSGHWRFFNFIVGNGPLTSYTGKIDIKAVLDWIKSKYSGFTNDMWLTRMEVGTEIDDSTQGSVKIKNLTFEVNGTAKSIKLGN